MNKYGAQRTWSENAQRWFDSKAEAHRAEELMLAQKLGGISDLEFQPKYVLCTKPKVTYAADFRYVEDGVIVVEDVKGILLRDTRTKLAWLQQLHNIEVRLIR